MEILFFLAVTKLKCITVKYFRKLWKKQPKFLLVFVNLPVLNVNNNNNKCYYSALTDVQFLCISLVKDIFRGWY